MEPLRPGPLAEALLRAPFPRRPVQRVWQDTLLQALDPSISDGDAYCAVALLLCSTGCEGLANAAFEGGVRPLHLVAAGGGTLRDPDRLTTARAQTLLPLLLGAGAELEARDELHGATALGWAAGNVCLAGLSCLVGLGADVEAEDHYGMTVQARLVIQGFQDAEDFLKAGGERAMALRPHRGR
ncbi:unnamed protein product [Effrenium voratum]|uniref:Ankyrin repeat domain-containing protein n=1 Tax=Effrenium voratum TaxID=2562239 RepID=A0AA36MLW6_9DINO|nr:unnamed protein product [Effrenium voratum]CAJ1452914.1 unnamed protein product [Effrenium voratum]